MRPPKQFFVYIMTNAPKPAVLYTGVTGNLPHRVWQHKNKLTPGFTSRYNLTRLVYYELFFYPDAIVRHREAPFVVSLLDRDSNLRRRFSAVLNRITDQVLEKLHKTRMLATNGR